MQKLYLSTTDRKIGGVCGGLGEYFEIDSLVIRLLFLLLTVTGGAGIILYIVMAIIVPQEGAKEERKKEKEENGIKEAEAEGMAGGPKNRKWHAETRSVIGFIIVLIGLNILFEQVFKFSPLYWINWGVVWSLIIIVIGLKLFSR